MFRTPLLLCFLVVSSLDGGIVITREGTAGDTFTNPLGCAAKCPSTATAATTLSCTCKCPNKNTWMQDTEDCVQESSCLYSFRSNRILAVAIPSRRVDDKLLPGQGLLYKGANAPNTGGYLITKFEYLKGNSWTNSSQKEQNYFYFQSQGRSRGRSRGQKYILWERIQLQDISSYAGAIIRFTVKPTDNNVAQESCLEIKIAGSLTYVAPTLETRVPVVTTSSVEKTTSYSSSTFYSDGPTSQEEMISNDPTTEYEDVTPSGVDVDDETTDSTGNEPPSSTKTISSDLPTLPPTVLEQKDSSDGRTGAIAGGTIGGIFIAAFVVALIVFLWRRRSGEFVTVTESEAVNLHNPAYSGKVKGKAPETVVYHCPDETEQRRADDVIYEEISQGPPKANGCSSNGACKEPVQVPNEEGPYEEPVKVPNEEGPYEEPVKVPKEEGPCEEPVKVLDEGPYEEPVSNAKNAEYEKLSSK